MVRKISPEGLYQIYDPTNFYAAMRDDVKLLLSGRRYTSLSTLIMCCIDALAANRGSANRGKFAKYVAQHFLGLCKAIEAACPGSKSGAAILYEEFRNGFAHLRSPKPQFAIAEDHELNGAWADKVEIDGKGQYVAINIDRLAKGFLTLLDQLERSQLATAP